ncbi:MAG: hypothetical protein AABX14_05335 [Candidatus Aenigmatarchaeota archaeon]
MATFPRNGSVEGQTALPSKKEIFDGKGPGAIEIPMHETIYKGVEWLGKYFGWVTSYQHKERKPKSPPKPPEKAGGYSRGDFGIGSRELSDEIVYRSFLNDARRHTSIVELPEYEMVRRFGDPDGYETGNVIYINRDRSAREKTKIGLHEDVVQKARKKTGRPHQDFDYAMRPLEPVGFERYQRGDTDVVESVTEALIRELAA